MCDLNERRMFMKRILVIVMTLVFVVTSSMAFAASDKPDSFEVLGDAFVLRPLGLAAVVGGSALFVLSLPIAAINKSIDTTARVFVVEPFRFTFDRPIGERASTL